MLDTSVLLADPESIFSFATADVVLPLKVIEELDNHKGRLDDVGRAARTVARLVEELRATSPGKDLKEPTPLAGGGTLRVVINGVRLDRIRELGLDIDKADNRILAAALGIDGQVTLVSADVNLRLKAAAVGLKAEEYRQVRASFHTEAHPGWKALDVSARLIDDLFESNGRGLSDSELADDDRETVSALAVNEFGVLNAGQQSALVRRHSARLQVLPRRSEAWGLRPRSKEQRFALDLLMDPRVPIVGLSGRAGTGKTILAIAAGLEQTFEPGEAQHYERIMIIRPLVAVGRQDIGFLPGDKNEKLEPWFATVEDTMAALREDVDHTKARAMLEGWVEEGKLSMEAVTFLRGRSLQRTFIIVDEAQNLEPLTLKTILTRLGAGSKVALVGDVSQIDSPFVSERTSAISILADRFSGQELFGHLVLTQGERSPVADLAAELL
ncbi:MAG: PhoH family protein [Actinomycetota bacterium]|nr:PhoH family protein [Actinomycetota bacterium]